MTTIITLEFIGQIVTINLTEVRIVPTGIWQEETLKRWTGSAWVSV